jgi:hypothetical protein
MSCPYTFAQNGKAEHIIRSTNNMVCSLLFQASMRSPIGMTLCTLPPTSSTSYQPKLCTSRHRTLPYLALRPLLTVNSCIEFRLDLQADKSPVIVKGPFFPRVVNPRYRICGTNV